jgi:phosphoglycerate dehydrogenase-like enzyme
MPEAAPTAVFLVGPLPAARVDRIRADAPASVRIEYLDEPGELLDRVGDADVVAGHVPAAALAKAGRLRWVHTWAAGPDRALYPEMVASPVVLTCSKGNGAIPLAEQAMLLMLMLNRDALRWVHAQQDRRWERFTHPELAGLTCGIIGLGYSGVDLALKAKAFHMRVHGLRRTSAPAEHVDRMFSRDQLHEFLRSCDVVVVTAPLTAETRGMLGEPEFRAMKSSALFICFSRGGIADDAALQRALEEGWIAGAGLDAHAIEPLPPDSPFWTAPNTIVTPHNGATSPQTPERGVDIFLDNLRRFAAGRELINVVDKDAGY